MYLYFIQPSEEQEEPQTVRNPFHLAPAITFGVLYAVILVLSNWAQSYFGNAGVYLSSLVAGLADVDAITLSMAQLNQKGELGAETATRAMVIAAAANTVLKGGIVAAWNPRIAAGGGARIGTHRRRVGRRCGAGVVSRFSLHWQRFIHGHCLLLCLYSMRTLHAREMERDPQ
jgi:hypothetical protein